MMRWYRFKREWARKVAWSEALEESATSACDPESKIVHSGLAAFLPILPKLECAFRG